MSSAHFSWNLVDDARQLFEFPFMVNAFRAGTIVAIVAGAIGWFMVLRRQAFAGHTLALVGFPGAAGAVWLGVSAVWGFFGFCLAAALLIAGLRPGDGQGYSEESAGIGVVQAFALAMAADNPERYVAKMTKSLRKGKIFVDYLRNSLEQTSVAAYSTRARSGAPVSAPVSWQEVGRTTGGNQYTVLNLMKRLGGLKQDPWQDIGRVKQALPDLQTLRKRG